RTAPPPPRRSAPKATAIRLYSLCAEGRYMEAALLPARRRGARRVRAGQSGFALLELAIALALASMVLIWTANRLVHQADDAAGRATGVWLLELKRGLDRMLERHFDSLAEGSPALGE